MSDIFFVVFRASENQSITNVCFCPPCSAVKERRNSTSGFAQQIKGRSDEKVAHIRYMSQPIPQHARTQAELGLVVGIDEPELAAEHGKSFFFGKTLELFHRYARFANTHQLVHVLFLNPAAFENAAVQRQRQQMQERRVRAEPAAAYLLVTAKGHVPRRESEERYPAGTEKTHCCMQESRLVGYMLYHVVRKHNVELSVEPAVAVEHIAAHKAAFHPVLGKTSAPVLCARPLYPLPLRRSRVRQTVRGCPLRRSLSRARALQGLAPLPVRYTVYNKPRWWWQVR